MYMSIIIPTTHSACVLPYAVTLSGTTSFRGLLVQARSMADDTPVGSFVAEAGITRLSSCARADVCFIIYNYIMCDSL